MKEIKEIVTDELLPRAYMQLKRIAPLDFLKEQIYDSEADDVSDTDFAIMTGELPHLLVDLMDALDGEYDSN